MKRTFIGVAVAAALLAPAAANAQNEWERQVRSYIERAGDNWRSAGYTLSHDVHTGSLRADGSELLTLQLRAGTTYQIQAVCDNDCTDIDLRVYDAAGDEMGHDILGDDTPVVSVTPRSSGTYTVNVIMWKCSTATCFYGVGAYSK